MLLFFVCFGLLFVSFWMFFLNDSELFGTFGLLFLLILLECFGKLIESFEMVLNVFECHVLEVVLNVWGVVWKFFYFLRMSGC